MKLDHYNMALSGCELVELRCWYSPLVFQMLREVKRLGWVPTPRQLLLSLMLLLFALKSNDRKTFTVNCAIDDLFISRALNTIYMLMPSKFLSLMAPSSLSSRLLQFPISISLQTSNIHLNIGPTCPSPALAIAVKGTTMQPDTDEKKSQNPLPSSLPLHLI